MSPSRPALEGVRLLLIDGNNLLHRISGGAGDGEVRVLLARLRGALPAGLETIVMLDGHPAPGTPQRQRVAAGLELRHAGRQTADDAIVGLLAGRPPAGRAATLTVTDDRALTERVRSAGGRTQRLAWLEALLDRRVRPAPAPGGMPDKDPDDGESERPAWKPGRGATRKRGNPRRRPRHLRGGA
ncbi:MAG TPA: hypothetical protein VNW68_02945 [Candidatus Limnocylindria bacterium]|nr:hypothetical protein [Candidatus Limnocylindria bacterium]